MTADKTDKSTGTTEGSSELAGEQAGNDKHDKQAHAGRPLTVVGIGASAGGLVPLQAFFDALPTGSGMAFVVVTHMAPDHESRLPEILQTHTEMPVHQVQALVAVEPNHVYVIPPGRHIVLTDTHLDAQEFDEPRGQRTPIDTFFRSLAAAHRNAVAIILSGGGTDGAVGVKAVKEEGGLLMVQDPKEAEHDSMPRAAIATGLADVVLPVRHMASVLIEYHENGVQLPTSPDALTDQERDTLQRILTQVHTQTGHDFGLYKRTTILRRVHRRMQLHGATSLDAYLIHLRQTPDEAHALFNEMLIGVTHFFRDGDAWKALAAEVIPALFEGKKAGDSVRVWTIGCSTGEEAYSAAILLLEYVASLKHAAAGEETSPLAAALGAGRIRLQVFASDLDEGALNKARQGLYPAAIEADVSSQRLARFFTREGDHYRVRREVRDIVLFSEHSLLRDPPFSRLDLISCRNLLIYLDRKLQDNVFDVFHYALEPQGYLFLGSAETADQAGELFQALDKHHRLYRARPWSGERPHVPTLPLGARYSQNSDRWPSRPLSSRRSADEGHAAAALEARHGQALEAYAPPSVLIDETYQILHVSETAGRYLLQPRGPLTGDLLQLVRPELRAELRAALLEAFTQHRTVVTSPVSVQFNGTPRRIMLALQPRRTPPGDAGGDSDPEAPAARQLHEALVLFLEHESDSGTAGDPATALTGASGAAATDQDSGPSRVQKLEAELQRVRERMHATAEQHETANEELRAANEELQSINEEYRSTTEELETSKEELQSINEELQTVNVELKNRVEDIARANSDLENLMEATQITTLFLDRELRIRHFTPDMGALFNIRSSDRGRPIGDLTHRLNYDALAADAAQVLQTLVPIQREIELRREPHAKRHWLLLRLRPYRTQDDRIDGVVATFIDVSELKEMEAVLRQAKEYSEKIVDTVREGLLVLEPDLTVQFANNSFFEMFGVDEHAAVGELFYRLGDGQWNISQLRTRLEELLSQAQTLKDFRVEHESETIGSRVMLLNARRLEHAQLILLTIEDITAREQYERELLAFAETLEKRVQERTEQVESLSSQLTLAEHAERARIAQILHDDLQQQLYALQMQLIFLRDDGEGEAFLQKIEEMKQALETATKTARRLSVDLSPPILEGEGLTEAIRWLAGQMREQHQLQAAVQAEGSFPVPDRGRRVLLFQMVRELLFNIVKHAGVRSVTVAMQQVDGDYRIEVVDEGAGFDLEAVIGDGAIPEGRGLWIMHERLQLIGGRLEIESAPGEGTRVTIVATPAERAAGTA